MKGLIAYGTNPLGILGFCKGIPLCQCRKQLSLFSQLQQPKLLSPLPGSFPVSPTALLDANCGSKLDLMLALLSPRLLLHLFPVYLQITTSSLKQADIFIATCWAGTVWNGAN